MKKLYYVQFEFDDGVKFESAKQIAHSLEGQVLNTVFPTKLVPRIPPGFLFRKEEMARKYEDGIKTLGGKA